MRKFTHSEERYMAKDGEVFDTKEQCLEYEEHLKWKEQMEKKHGKDFEFSALKNDRFNYFYHSKLGIIMDLCEDRDCIWTLPELKDEDLDEIVAQIIFANKDRRRVPEIYNKIYRIVKHNKKRKRSILQYCHFKGGNNYG